MSNVGFVAGTLIHTDKGLVPIQDIKVGDLILSKPVLSKPEDGSGDIEYKPVVKTFMHEDKEMWIVRLEKNNTSPYRLKPGDENFDIQNYLLADEKIQSASRFSSFLATPNHPVWVVGAMENPQEDIEFYDRPHFKRVDELQQYEIAVNTDGVMYTVERVQPTYQVANDNLEFNPNYYWYQKHYHEDYYDDYVQDAEAHMLDYSEVEYKGMGYVDDISFYQEKGYLGQHIEDNGGTMRMFNQLTNAQGEHILYQATVYNFEVADNHTYFIGRAGLWVHNTNCDGKAQERVTGQVTSDTSPEYDKLVKEGATQQVATITGPGANLSPYNPDITKADFAKLKEMEWQLLKIVGSNGSIKNINIENLQEALRHSVVAVKDGAIRTKGFVYNSGRIEKTGSQNWQRIQQLFMGSFTDFTSATKNLWDKSSAGDIIEFMLGGMNVIKGSGGGAYAKAIGDVLQTFKVSQNGNITFSNMFTDIKAEFGAGYDALINHFINYKQYKNDFSVLTNLEKQIKEEKLVLAQLNQEKQAAKLEEIKLLEDELKDKSEYAFDFQRAQANGDPEVLEKISVTEKEYLESYNADAVNKKAIRELAGTASLLETHNGAFSFSLAPSLRWVPSATKMDDPIKVQGFNEQMQNQAKAMAEALAELASNKSFIKDMTPEQKAAFFENDASFDILKAGGSTWDPRTTGDWWSSSMYVSIPELKTFTIKDKVTGELVENYRFDSAGFYALEKSGDGYKAVLKNKEDVLKELDSNNPSHQGLIKSLNELANTRAQNQLVDGLPNESHASPTDAAQLEQQLESMYQIAKQYWLDAGATQEQMKNISITQGQLANNALATTEGKLITLSSDAAGWGWFIDKTPNLNEEFTLGKNSYKANVGSEAESKIDLLTVLIHEIGNVLGVSHRTEGDVMTLRLAEGERRLPNQVDSQYLSWLQHNATAQIENAGTQVLQAKTWQAPTTLEQLSNRDFANAGDNWLTSGDIRFNNVNHSATLIESDDANTSLRQAFSLNADNRLLSFTIADSELNKTTKQAGDAFEVALLNAKTGKAVTQITDLTRTDSLLNIQAGGREQVAMGVQKVLNADGTSTYFIDLTNWYQAQVTNGASTDVLLSFDLLGFGEADSSVSIRDIKLSSDPVASHDRYEMLEDAVLTDNLFANDILVGNPVQTVAIMTQPQYGSVTLTDDGSFSYTPDANYFGTDSFSYQFTDSEGNVSNIASVELTIDPVNDAPVIDMDVLQGLIDGQDVVAGKALTLSLSVTGTDVEGDALSVLITQQPEHGSLTLQDDGSYVLLFDEEYEGAGSFSYVITDGTDVSEQVTASFNVLPSNKPPIATDSRLSLLEDGTVIIPLSTLGSDEDGDALTISITQSPVHGSLVQQANAAGVFELVYTPVADYFGMDSFSYTLADDKVSSNEATATLTISAVNDAPVTQDDIASTDEDKAVTISVQSNDNDIDSALLTTQIVTTAQHGVIAINDDGSVTYTPNDDYHGEDSFTYVLNDGEAISNTATIRITITPVNDAPELTGQQLTIAEDTNLVINPLLTASDVDGDALTVVITTQPSHGTLTKQDDGSYVYRANENYHGTDSIRYYVTDSELQSAERVIDLTITPVNDAPELTGQQLTIAEDTALIINPLATASDSDSDNLMTVITAQPKHGSLLQQADGSYVYRADENSHGTDSISYYVTDGELQSAERVIDLTITPVNDAPELIGQQLTIAEDTGLVINPLLTASDVDGDALTVVITTQPSHGSIRQQADGSYVYRADKNYHGTDSIRYYVTDGELQSAERVIDLTITPVNDAPVLANQALVIAEDTGLVINPLLTASDVENDNLTVVVTTQPIHGSLIQQNDGTYVYQAHANYNGSDSLSYYVTDGELQSAERVIDLTITPVNDAPELTGQQLTIAEDTNLVINPLLAASDVDGNALKVIITAQPSHGSLRQQTDGSYIYRADENYHGTDSISYYVTDGELQSAERMIELTITPVNDAPELTGQQLTIAEDTALIINPLATASDIDGDDLTVVITNKPVHGILTQQVDGTYIYQANVNYNGLDSLSYYVTDGELQSSERVIDLTITPVNDAPELTGQQLTIAEDTGLVINPLLTASDVDGNALTVIITAQPSHGSLSQQTDGSYVYRADENYHGTDSISYYVTDGELQSAERMIELTITPVNDAPVASNSLVTGVEDTSYLFGWSDFAMSDVEGDRLTLRIVELPHLGAIQQRLADGSWTAVLAGAIFDQRDIDAGILRFVPLHNQSGGTGYTAAGYGDQQQHYAAIGFVVNDGQLDSQIGKLTIDIDALTDAPILSATPKPSTSNVFATDFEGIVNNNASSTLLVQDMLDGWQLIKQNPRYWQQWQELFKQGKLPYGNDGFEIWHNGDVMVDKWNVGHRVSASDNGDGTGAINTGWLELNDATKHSSQTLGLEREIQTVEGAEYQLSFDYAGRNGFDERYTGISVYLGTTLLKQYSAASVRDALDWHTVDVDFVGSGRAEMLRIVIDSDVNHPHGRGAMIDNIRLDEAVNTYKEDQPIALSSIQAALMDTDGSEVLTLTLAGLPIGTHLSDGNYSWSVTADSPVDITAWQLDNLQLTPPSGFSGDIAATVVATSTELSTGVSASQTLTLPISVDAVADKPIIELLERDIPTRQVVHTDFENVTNWNKDSDTLYWFNSGNTGGSVWNATSAKWGKLVGFEFFSKEDYVTTANGKKTKLTASPSGNHWLMLHDGVTLDGRYKSSQLLGIDKNITTIKDVLYTVSFDYSAMLELKSDKLSRIEVYANGKLLGSHQGVSADNLNWTNLSYDFIGTGNNTSIQILLDGVAINDQSSKGRMAMIDNLSVVETLTARIDNQGAHLYALAGVSTPLPLIDISSSDKDGSEAYSLQIVVPYGVTIGDGTYSITNPYRNPITMDLTGMDLSKLTLQTPNHYCGDMSLTMIAKSREISNGSEAMSTYDIKVTVLQGEPAIVNNAYITSTLSLSSVQHEADINSEVATPVLNVSKKQTSPHASAPVCNERSGKIDITVAAQPVRVDDFDATDNWLANMESKAQKKWRG